MLHANHAQVLQKSVSVCKFCSAFVSQVRDLRFEEEVEKRRVLEDALHVLATEHHALECSIGAHEVTERFPPKSNNLTMGHFRVPTGLSIKTKLSAQPLTWK